jgi:hypothetical protein
MEKVINEVRGYCKIRYQAYSLVVLLGFSGVIVLYRFCWNIENQLWWI